MKKIIVLLLIIYISACKEDHKLSENITSKELSRKTFFEFYFPDTLHVNKIYKGGISYKSELDTLTTFIHKKGDTMRLLSFHLKHNKKLINDNFQHILNNKKSRSFAAKFKDSIHFEYMFKETGNYYLEGVLEDEVYYATSNAENPLKIVREYNHVTFPVYVTDDENIIDNYGSFVKKNNDGESILLQYKKK